MLNMEEFVMDRGSEVSVWIAGRVDHPEVLLEVLLEVLFYVHSDPVLPQVGLPVRAAQLVVYDNPNAFFESLSSFERDFMPFLAMGESFFTFFIAIICAPDILVAFLAFLP